jgi:hypothetical protein
MGEHNDELERREREEEYEEFINVYGRENEREDDLVQSLNLLKNNTMPPPAVMQRLDFLEPTSQQYTANTTNAITKPHREQQSSLFSLPPRSKQPSQTHNDYLSTIHKKTKPNNSKENPPPSYQPTNNLISTPYKR